MIYPTAQDWQNAPHKRIALFGMSGLGKTYLSDMLRRTGNWFHYSIDYRIGTRYMGEHIVNNIKREAMKSPLLRELLRSDSIAIKSRIGFENLTPLSSYLGKPGNPDLGGIAFDEYLIRQRQHRDAEIAATIDSARFARNADEIYGYDHFIADTSGSICEVVDPANPDDPVLTSLSQTALPVWIKGADSHTDTLLERFRAAPKPMYYNEAFLQKTWNAYLAQNNLNPEQVDPDAFAIQGYASLLEHRLPLYAAMARNWGVTVEADQVTQVRDAQDFTGLITDAIGSTAG